MDQPIRDARQNLNRIYDEQLPKEPSSIIVNSPAHQFNVWDTLQNQPPFMQQQPSYTLVPTALAQAISQLQLCNSLNNSSLPISYNSPQYAPNKALTPNGSLPISYNSPQYAPNKALTPNGSLPISYNSPQYAPNQALTPNGSLPISYNSPQYAPNQALTPNGSLPISYNSPRYAPNEPVEQNDSLRISYNSQQYAPSEPVAHNDSLPISYNSHQYTRNQRTPNRMSQNVNTWKSKRVKTRYYGPYQTSQNKSAHSHNNYGDLRKKLIRRKCNSETFSANEPHDLNENERTKNENKKWNHELEDTSVQMNLTPLKALTSSGTNFDQWYIVVDADVILNNFIYLVNMTADPNFHLLIPHHVMSELQELVAESSNAQDRRTLRFLKDQINSGQALIGEEEEAHESATYMSVMTCIHLSSNYNVILISNKAETLKSFVYISKKINIFSMQEIKDILAKRGNCLPKSNSPTLAIKKTAPNDVSGKLVAHETFTERNLTATEPSNNENALGVKSQAGCTQSSEQSVAKDLDTGVGTELVNSKDDCHLSCTKSASPNQSSTNSAKNSNRKKIESAITRSYCTRSISQNQSPNSNLENNTIETAIRAKVDGACSSSSSLAASDRVSLDTIQMKNIISMKTLTSTHNSVKAQKEQAESFTSPGSSSKSSTKCTNRKLKTTNCTSVANVDENIVIEETSTSGVISNSESYSEKGRSAVAPKDVKKVALKTLVMFGISCQSMEEVLKTRSDEWVFRFVQIMEEALRVKLHEKLAYDNKEYPAPKNLQEAARCIIKKFSNNFNVVDAANKLSFSIYKMSDEHGNMDVNMEPADFMTMYSYGVFLVDTFQDMSADCKEIDCKKEKTNGSKEDAMYACSCFEVVNAKESLIKLLFDIQNAKSESFVGDRSSDTLHPDDQYGYEISQRDETQGTSACNQQAEILEEMRCVDQNDITHNTSPNLRNRNITETQNVPAKVSLPSKGVVEDNFFNSLQLQKTFHTNTPESPANANELINNNTRAHSTGQERTPAPQNDENKINLRIHLTGYFTANSKDVRTVTVIENTTESPANANELINNNTWAHSNGQERTPAQRRLFLTRPDDLTANSQTKVVRTFTVIEEFERRIKARQKKQQNYEDDIEVVIDGAILAAGESEGNGNNEGSDSGSRRNFKRFMGRLVRILGAAFTRVHYLCDQFIKTVQGSNPFDISNKHDLYCEMDIAYLLIRNIHLSLDRISKLEQDKDNNFQKLLKIAKIDDFVPDDKLCLEYMSMIESCKKTAAVIQNSVQDIIKLLPE